MRASDGGLAAAERLVLGELERRRAESPADALDFAVAYGEWLRQQLCAAMTTEDFSVGGRYDADLYVCAEEMTAMGLGRRGLWAAANYLMVHAELLEVPAGKLRAVQVWI